jgi:hypothetical protein
MTETIQQGEVLMSWKAHSYPHYERGGWWFLGAGIIGALLLVWALWSGNYSFAAFVVMFGIVVVLQATRPPQVIDVAVTDVGVLVGPRFIPHRDVREFWMVYDPPIKTLYLELKRALLSRVQVDLEDVDPVELRETLKRYVREDLTHDHEPAVDVLSRIFKI